ncbi:MAG: hypothetical protein HGA84_05940 [Syntrophobacteraceae bacterium]|nr:hypothetical protein [Syntrophobacteraceae bacterium]
MVTPRRDPFFDVETPVVFAHRGGAGEVPESTEEAFRHAAITVGVDVLELDIQISGDQEIVVWHGPGLGNVHDGRVFFAHGSIHETRYHEELHGKTWVAHPQKTQEMLQSPARQLLTLEAFLGLVNQMEHELKETGNPRNLHLNIELKPGPRRFGQGAAKGWEKLFDRLFTLLRPEAKRRRVILASADHGILSAMRHRMDYGGHGPYVTNLSPNEQMSFRHLMPQSLTGHAFRMFGCLFMSPRAPSSKPYAFETYFKLCTRDLIERVRSDGSAFYVFLTGIMLFPAVDQRSEAKLQDVLKELLDMGVDGIMTDYPAKVTKLLRLMKVRA